ncbi:hypothetical protein MMC28_001552 [Mycoblastus sanguinarius]|nr:hypothetical protein [Mycoblastus sanguinarius]
MKTLGMKTYQLLRNTPLLRSTIRQTFSTASRTAPPTPSSLFNVLTRSARRRPLTPSRNSKRHYSTPPHPDKPPYNPTPHLNSPQPSLSISQRFRKLSREYGWSAIGVYLLLSALDFPFCFAAVRYLGTDRIGHYEHVILEWVRAMIPDGVRETWREMAARVGIGGKGEVEGERDAVTVGGVAGEETRLEGYGAVTGEREFGVVGYDHGVKEAEKMNKSENASIWTQLALAYAIHKSFIFIRVPLTAAVTPKVVKVLRGWGWDIGKRKPKGPKGA